MSTGRVVGVGCVGVGGGVGSWGVVRVDWGSEVGGGRGWGRGWVMWGGGGGGCGGALHCVIAW